MKSRRLAVALPRPGSRVHAPHDRPPRGPVRPGKVPHRRVHARPKPARGGVWPKHAAAQAEACGCGGGGGGSGGGAGGEEGGYGEGGGPGPQGRGRRTGKQAALHGVREKVQGSSRCAQKKHPPIPTPSRHPPRTPPLTPWLALRCGAPLLPLQLIATATNCHCH